MAKLIWFMCINGAAGIVIYFIAFFVFIMLMMHKYGDDIVTEAMDRLVEESNETYSALTDHPEIIKALSAIITIFLWEFAIPVLFYMLRQMIVDLYNIRNRP